MTIANLQMTDRKIEESRTGIEIQALTNCDVLGQFIEVEMRQNSGHSIHSVIHFHRMMDSIIQNDAEFVMSNVGLEQGRGEKSVATARA